MSTNKITFSTKVSMIAAGLAAAASVGMASANADVIEISANGVVDAGKHSTVRDVGASGTNSVRGTDRLSVFSGLSGSKVSTSTVYIPAATACSNAPANNYTDIQFRGCDDE